MEVKAVIDRFEGEKAVLLLGEEEIAVNWPVHCLPAVKEGDILLVKLALDVEATAQAQSLAQELLAQLQQKLPQEK